ncbi:hypothetical protein U0070_009126 [Myodes glareolus]|uniref:Uncharacterized protein n=1 Tax=Myodes glareolus TaxID=447135 RepID=A0AAW0H0K5_MYOGA
MKFSFSDSPREDAWVLFLSRALKSQQSCFSPVRKALSDSPAGAASPL